MTKSMQEEVHEIDDVRHERENWFENNFPRLRKLPAVKLVEEINKRTKVILLAKLKGLDTEVEKALATHIKIIVGHALGARVRFGEVEFDSRFRSGETLPPLFDRISKAAEKACSKGIDEWVKTTSKIPIPKEFDKAIKEAFSEQLFENLHDMIKGKIQKSLRKYQLVSQKEVEELLNEFMEKELKSKPVEKVEKKSIKKGKGKKMNIIDANDVDEEEALVEEAQMRAEQEEPEPDPEDDDEPDDDEPEEDPEDDEPDPEDDEPEKDPEDDF